MNRIILSLDGGGIRGAATAEFLSLLEKSMSSKIFDCFNYFAGTSTGGLISMHIALNKATGDECTKLYTHENGSIIMDKSVWDRYAPLYLQTSPKYDGKGKQKFISKIFGKKLFTSANKPVLITAYDINNRKIVVFKSTGGSDVSNDLKAAVVADATSAAPAYFPTVKLAGDKNRWLIDGGVAANNPAMCALAEAIKDKIPLDKIYLISIGTGLPTREIGNPDRTGEASQSWGGAEWLNHGLIDHMFSGNMEAAHYMCAQILGENYIRINGYLENASDDMDDTSNGNISNLKNIGKEWFKTYGKAVVSLLQKANA